MHKTLTNLFKHALAASRSEIYSGKNLKFNSRQGLVFLKNKIYSIAAIRPIG
jgi:hypothetical protein